MDNITRYPQDLISIYRCIKELGKRHPELVGKFLLSLLFMFNIVYLESCKLTFFHSCIAKCRKSLFDIDNRYMTKEPNTESPACKYN